VNTNYILITVYSYLFCVFDVINTIALSAQFVGRNPLVSTPALSTSAFSTPATCSRFFHSRIFSAPSSSSSSVGNIWSAIAVRHWIEHRTTPPCWTHTNRVLCMRKSENSYVKVHFISVGNS